MGAGSISSLSLNSSDYLDMVVFILECEIIDLFAINLIFLRPGLNVAMWECGSA